MDETTSQQEQDRAVATGGERGPPQGVAPIQNAPSSTSRNRGRVNRRLIAVIALAAFGASIYWAIQLVTAGPFGVSETAYHRIRMAMTKEAVVAVVGHSPGYVGEKKRRLVSGPLSFVHAREGDRRSPFEVWENGDLSIFVYLDQGDRVIGKELYIFRPPPAPCWFDRVLGFFRK